jgi:hypothetical protein
VFSTLYLNLGQKEIKKMTDQLTRTEPDIEDACQIEKFHEQYIKEGKYLKNL